MRRQNIRCPKCNGVINKSWLVDLTSDRKYAIFVVECWSGDLKKKSYHHFFKVKVPLLEGTPYNFDEKLAHEIEKILPKDFDIETFPHIATFLEEHEIELKGDK